MGKSKKELVTLEVRALLKSMSDEIYRTSANIASCDDLEERINEVRETIKCYIKRIEEHIEELPPPEDNDWI